MGLIQPNRYQAVLPRIVGVPEAPTLLAKGTPVTGEGTVLPFRQGERSPTSLEGRNTRLHWPFGGVVKGPQVAIDSVQSIESQLTPAEISNWGTLFSELLQKDEKAIFLFVLDPSNHSLVEHFWTRFGCRLQDYLATKMDLLREPSELPIPQVTSDVSSSVSSMDPTDLLSGEIYGAVKPSCSAYFIYGVSLSTSSGYQRLNPDHFFGPRTIPLTSSSDYQFDDRDVEVTLPFEQNGRIPVPFGYTVVATHGDETYEIYDPTSENPFLTSFAKLPSDSTLRLIIRKRDDEPRANPNLFKPTDSEISYWEEVLPLPAKLKKTCEATPEKSWEAVLDYIRSHFMYVCDERLGGFIQRHSQNLGLLMQGLRMGHCDLISWVTAAYLRQLRYAAVVDHVLTTKNGMAFHKARHSTVILIHDDGSFDFLDVTEGTPTVDGYKLHNISDGEMQMLEKDFDDALDKESKLEIIRKLRNRVSLKNATHRELAGDISSMNALWAYLKKYMDKKLYAWDDLSDNDTDVADQLIEGILNNPLHLLENEIQKRVINFFSDIFSEEEWPLRKASSQWEKFDILARPISEKVYEYDVFSRDYSSWKQYRNKKENLSLPEGIDAQVAWISGANDEFEFHERFNPFKKPSTTLAKVQHYVFLKLVAKALYDPEVYSKLNNRFGLNREQLREFAISFLPQADSAKFPRGVRENLTVSQDESKKAHLLHANYTVKPDEYQKASQKFQHFLLSLKSPQKNQPKSDPWDFLHVDYDSSIDAQYVDWNASARSDKLIAKIVPLPRKSTQDIGEDLYVYLDNQVFFPSNNIYTFYARFKVILETLVKYSRVKKTTVFVAMGDRNYLKIDGKKPIDIDLLIADFVFAPLDRSISFMVKPTDVKKSKRPEFPKNLLFLTDSEGKVAAAKFLLRGKTNLTVQTYSQVGLDIFPRLRVGDD